MESRKYTLALLAVLGLLVIGWTGWWFYAAGLALKSVEDWTEDRSSDGWTIALRDIATSGYPLQLTVELTGLHVIPPDESWQAAGERVDLTLPPWRLDHYAIHALSPIHLSAKAVPATGADPVAIEGLEGGLALGKGDQPDRLRLTTAKITGPDGIEIARAGLSVDRPLRIAQTEADTIASVRLEVIQADLPNLFPANLSHRFEAGILNFDLSGPQSPAGKDLADRAAQWRDAGGKIDVRELAVIWQDLNLRGDGTVTLDAAMRPLGAFSLHAAGLVPTVRRLEKAGILDGQTRRYVELGAGLLSFGAPKGEMSIPVALQDGLFYLGPVPLGPLPAIFPGYGPAPSAAPQPAKQESPAESFIPPPPPPVVSDETLSIGNTGSVTPPDAGNQ